MVEKTDNMVRMNQEVEDQILKLKSDMTDDEQAKRAVQENFSQRLFVVQRKLEKLREILKVTESELNNTDREQLKNKTEELQKALNHTHQHIIENQSLVEKILTDTGSALAKIPIEPGRKAAFSDTFTGGFSGSRTSKYGGKSVLATAALGTKATLQHVNLTKEETKRIAVENYEKMLAL